VQRRDAILRASAAAQRSSGERGGGGVSAARHCARIADSGARAPQAFMRWSQNAVQPSRPGIAVADATRDNTVSVARAVLGWAKHINGREDGVDLRWLLDGDLLAAYVSWGGAIRRVGCTLLACGLVVHSHAAANAGRKSRSRCRRR
jgi:hypothetical protein